MNKIKYSTLLLLMACALSTSAQTAKSAYFLEGTFHNYQLNPAMKAERGFLSLLAGNMSMVLMEMWEFRIFSILILMMIIN